MLDQRVQVQTAHLNDKYEALTIEYKKLCRLIMVMRSHMGGSCGPFNWSHDPSDGGGGHVPSFAPPLF
jgi:hypothetical protein